MRNPPRQNGFILVLVLVVLAIAGTLLTALARRCGETAVRAAQAQQELQVRWGQLSCQAAVLPQANLLFQARDHQLTPGQSVSCELRQSLLLGELRFDLIVGDESAKVNANRLWVEVPGMNPLETRTLMENSLRELQSDDPHPLAVHLRPLSEPFDADPELFVRYPSPEQLVMIRHPRDLAGGPGRDPALRRRLTCWGSGQLSLRHAELATIQQVLGHTLSNGEIAQLDLARRNPDFDLGKTLGKIGLSQAQFDQVTPLVTGTSDCYSLWMIAAGKTRTWYRLCVRRTDIKNDASQQWVLDW